jgi:catechol-2,3-dioxygenase
MIRRVNAVVLFVENLDRAMTFYRDTLGLEVANITSSASSETSLS